MTDIPGYKPALPNDPEYIKKINAQLLKTKEPAHLEFNRLNHLLELLGIKENPYDFIHPEITDFEKSDAVAEKAFELLHTQLISPEIQKALDALWNYLSDQDPLEHAELIFVFGGPELSARGLFAAELYKRGLAPKILFSGHGQRHMQDVPKAEAEIMATVAKEAGVPEENIIIENKSKNTPENVILSFKEFEKLNFFPKSLILCTVPEHMLRAYLTFKSQATWNPKLMRAVVPTSYSKLDYYKNKNIWKFVFFEYLKLYGAHKMGHI